MRRAEGLSVVSRRDFCGAFATCMGLALVGCSDDDGSGILQTSGLNGPDGQNGTGPDAGTTSHVDAGVSNPDAGGSAATCPSSGATDVGLASSFAVGTAKYFSGGNFFVVRDSGGLYALTARCTHSGCAVQKETNDFYCPCHGATFSLDGDPLSGPVYKALVHYEMCTLANGHVGVVRSVTVAKTERLVA